MIRNLREAILFLNICRITNLKIINLVSDGNIYKLINIKKHMIKTLLFFNDRERKLLEDMFDSFNADFINDKLYSLSINYLTIVDKNYPQNLLNIYDAPAIIYYKGKFPKRLDNILAIVGNRKSSEYGKWAVEKIVKELADYDVQIVSGMALGIDRFAHLAAINNKIPTIGVLASSLEIRYPKSNNDLYDLMNDQLLISEFPLDTNPIKRNFVFRNRIISALAFGTLVVEAQEKSGSLITAKYALEQDRMVYAIPGNINALNSQGTNKLIKNGAKLIQDAEDIVNEIPYINEIRKIKAMKQIKLDRKIDQEIYALLEDKILSVNDISNLTPYSISEIYQSLFNLENKKLVNKLDANYYSR